MTWLNQKDYSVKVEYPYQHPDIAAVGSSAHYIDSSGNVALLCEVPTENDDIRRRIFHVNCFVHSSVMFRRQVLIEIGGYNQTFSQAQDYELFLRLCEHHKLANIKKPLISIDFDSTKYLKQNLRLNVD